MEKGVNTRETVEQFEKEQLSPYASFSANAKRQFDTTPCDIRTEYQRDRDKIIHSKSFRRLKHKTQVFIAPEGDHYRTRLTHTLEVMQISRTMARALRLNEDLAEAIAYGHDLGHTPFGHSGEQILNEILYKEAKKVDETALYHEKYFEHNAQSLRVVDILENEKGLNLTNEVRDGILHHSGNSKPYTLEGQIVHMADRIAYINHDIDDAIRANVIQEKDLPEDCLAVLGRSHRDRINNMIFDVIENSVNKDEIIMSGSVRSEMLKLRQFMFRHVYIGSVAKVEETKAKKLIEALFYYYMENPQALPEDKWIKCNENNKVQMIVDYIAGMTDQYAISKHHEYFIPYAWKLF